MDTKRLFIGSFIKEESLLKELPIIQKDFADSVNAKWVEAENLHFTYAFLGNTPADSIPLIKSALNDLLVVHKCDIALKGIRVMPNIYKAKLIYIDIKDSNRILHSIQNQIAQILEFNNVSFDNKEFRPHLTLGRIKFAETEKFENILKLYQNQVFAELSSISLSLVESKLTNAGPIYTEL